MRAADVLVAGEPADDLLRPLPGAGKTSTNEFFATRSSSAETFSSRIRFISVSQIFAAKATVGLFDWKNIEKSWRQYSPTPNAEPAE